MSPKNEHIEIGNYLHNKKRKDNLKETFFEDKNLRIKGKIDYLTIKDKIILYELKKGNSRKIWDNDRMQVSAYWFLAKASNLQIQKAILEYAEGSKFELKFDKKDKEKLKETIAEMEDLKKLPEKCENKGKCRGCNFKEYCWL